MMQGYKDLVIQAKNDSKYMQSLPLHNGTFSKIICKKNILSRLG